MPSPLTEYLDVVVQRLEANFAATGLTVHSYSSLTATGAFQPQPQAWLGIERILTPTEIQRGDGSQVGEVTGRLHLTQSRNPQDLTIEPWAALAELGTGILDWIEHLLMDAEPVPPHCVGLPQPLELGSVTQPGSYGLPHDPGTGHMVVFWQQQIIIGTPSSRLPGVVDPINEIDYAVGGVVTGEVEVGGVA